MTRQQYQNTYGQAPSVSSQPIKMTRQEYSQKYGSGVEEPKTLGGFAGNVVKSGGRAVGGVVSSAVNVLNPNADKNTLVGMGRLASGAAQLLDPTEGNKIAKEIPGIGLFGNNEQTARNVGSFYNQRYGGLDKIGNTLYNDPIGVAMDVSTVAGGAGALATKAAGLATKGATAVSLSSNAAKLGRAGQTLGKVSRFTDPLQVVGMGLGKAGSKVSSFARGTARVAENADDIARLESIFAKNNVELPASATTNNQFVRQTEALTAKGPFGSKVDARFQASSQLPKTLLQNVTDANTGDVSAARNSLGQSVRGDLKKYATGFKKQASAIYDDLEKTLGDAPVQPLKTQTMIDKLYDQQRISALPQGAGQKLLEDLYLNLENTNTYAALNQTRKDVGQLLNSTDPLASGQKAQLKAIYGAIESDLKNVADAGNPAPNPLIAKAPATNPLMAEAQKYGSAEEFMGEVKNRVDKVWRLAGNEALDISVVGSTARGKLIPNDLDILITPKNKLDPLTPDKLKTRTELTKVFKDEIRDLFPDKKIHIILGEFDPTRGPKSQLADVYNQATQAKPITDILQPKSAANPDIAAALKTKAEIDAKWNEFRKLMNKQEGKNIFSDVTDIEDIVPRIYKPNNASSINRLKQFTNPATFKELGDTLITQIVNSSVNQRTGLIDPLKWKNVLAKWDTPTLRAALGDDGLARIEALSKTIDDAGFSQNMITNSSKAYAGSQTAMLGSAAVGGSSLVGSILTLNPVPILSYLGVNALGSAIFGSNAGRSVVFGTAKMPGLGKFGSGAKSVFSKSYNLGKVGRLIPSNSTEKEPTQPSRQQLLERERKDLSYPPIIRPTPPVKPQKLTTGSY